MAYSVSLASQKGDWTDMWIEWKKHLTGQMVFFLLLSCYSVGQESRLIELEHARLNVVEWFPAAGNGELVIALPGSGGDHSRYKRIAPLIADGGYHIVVVNQRGVMGSSNNLNNLSMQDLADDVIAVSQAFGAEKFHMMGWAFGNRTSRMVATLYPDRISSLTLIAAGGLVPALTEPGELGELLGNSKLSEAEKIKLARQTLFSSATGDEVVLDYVTNLKYWPEARAAQRFANQNTPVEFWSAGGSGPMLMVMGEDDLTAPLENAYIMKAEHGDRLSLAVISGAGHAVGLEKPKETVAAILPFLKSHPF
ncbi:MAG: alpha/beta hydrolase [Gammaproteobacteria bacterium]|nr:alpha/beta hydrolase [Gammaproteobacteria bacterium]MDG1951264.1 alpha/beta hydrolase [Gammaproteobacteria bacterium]MDG2118418.1 alpha/beta hydrolase [Gammaproteobacteria bacterium]